MADPFVAEIRIFPNGFAPDGWARCDGQLLPVAQNPGLFTLLGTTYGGDGTSTFALPDLRDRAPMHPGTGPGLSPRAPGEAGGSETVSLEEDDLPAHTHPLVASRADALDRIPGGQLLARGIGVGAYAAPGALTTLAPGALSPAGGAAPHDNMMPYLAVHFCIALRGVFPTPY